MNRKEMENKLEELLRTMGDDKRLNKERIQAQIDYLNLDLTYEHLFGENYHYKTRGGRLGI